MKKRKYGFINEPKNTDFVFGAGKIPEEILQPDGNWMPWLPVKEFQAPYNFETYACVTFTLLTCLETQIKRRYGIEPNFSDRFLSIVSGTKNPGNSPQAVCEFLRKIGVVPQELWPYDNTINSWEKWSEKIPPKLYELAREFNNEWDFRYEQVPSKAESITEALKMSPLLISVSAWYPKGDKFYRPKGMRDNHATTMFYERIGDFRRVFDSYDRPHIKDVEWEAVPEFIQRYWIKRKVDVEKQKSVIWELISKLLQMAGLISFPAPIAPVIAPQPLVEPHGSYLIEWAKAIELYEGANKSWNNPGAIRSVKGPFLKFPTYEKGWNYLLDYLTRAATGKHKAYKPEFTLQKFFEVYSPVNDGNNPTAYASFVAKRIGVTKETQIKNLV